MCARVFRVNAERTTLSIKGRALTMTREEESTGTPLLIIKFGRASICYSGTYCAALSRTSFPNSPETVDGSKFFEVEVARLLAHRRPRSPISRNHPDFAPKLCHCPGGAGPSTPGTSRLASNNFEADLEPTKRCRPKCRRRLPQSVGG
jgi:hypothetical protein